MGLGAIGSFLLALKSRKRWKGCYRAENSLIFGRSLAQFFFFFLFPKKATLFGIANEKKQNRALKIGYTPV